MRGRRSPARHWRTSSSSRSEPAARRRAMALRFSGWNETGPSGLRSPKPPFASPTSGWPPGRGPPADEPALYFCECGLLDCREKLSLTLAQYEQVRAKPEQFFVMAGHQLEDVEDVIAEEDGFLVIEKPASVFELVRGTDPRADD